MNVYKPRNDFVLFRMISKDKIRGLAMPQISEQAKERIIEAVGPDVVGLSVGQKVLVVGTIGSDVVPLPNEGNMFLTRQGNIIVTIEEVESNTTKEEKVLTS